MILENDQPLLVVDSHVHLHTCYALSNFMDSVFSHSNKVARIKRCENNYISLLLLTEGRGERGFETLLHYTSVNRLIEGQKGTYRFFPTKENYSLSVFRKDSPPHFFVAGRQIRTLENLEVLALASDVDIPDGLPLEVVVHSIAKTGAIPVIPWGFGKWTGKRGKILTEYLESRAEREIFLGDISGRLPFFPQPKQFVLGKEIGIRILPGSDPLPFPSEVSRPGSFGFTMRCSIDTKKPGYEIRRCLSDRSIEISPYGDPVPPLHFVANQVAMQVRKLRLKL